VKKSQNLSPLLEHSKDIKKILILVAASALKLRVEDWTILNSRWTLVLDETKCIFRPVLSYW